MICSHCGIDNPTEAKFCLECGRPVAKLCPACKTPLPSGAKFCLECGAALNGAPLSPASPSRTTAVTERRFVTVLFADLVGFTSLSERRDSEEVRDLLSQYFDVARDVVGRYGGTIEKFIGDAVMAVWGTPVTQEDDAERAVRAALELVAAVGELGDRISLQGLQARAGVQTGEATVNLAAVGEGMVAGDLVNTASRIQTAAEPGAVFVGEQTRRASEAAVAYEDAGSHSLKGKAEEVRLWRALRVVAGVGGLMKSEGLEAPFVGRDRELRLAKELFHAAAENSRAHLVQVTGIAGIGKSRLVWEFFKYMDGLKSTYFWHRGRCLAYGDGVTYWALAEMVRGRAGILEGEERAVAVDKLHSAVGTYLRDPEERQFVEPRLRQLLGLEERSSSDRQALYSAWRLFFERLADEDPVIMVFEDVQWADPSLVEFIDYLLERSRTSPLFVMTLGRPDAPTSVLSGLRRNVTSIYLEPLADGEMRNLLAGLAPGLPTELGERILSRAAGVPLYAVETVRMLIDRGLLVREGVSYKPAGPIPELDIPETLHALIAARLDGLSSTERRVVQDAAVLGKTFTQQAIGTLSGVEADSLGALLSSLVAKEILSVQADPRSPERGQYGFLQDLVRTVAYEMLSKRDRRTKHLTAAAYLEQAWGSEEEEIVEVVASHLLEAYRLDAGADDAAAIRERARTMLIRAGERAASLAAGEEAETYFSQAAELTQSELERAELIERAGEMAQMRGRAEKAVERFEAAIALFLAAGHSSAAARCQTRRAGAEFSQDLLEQATATAAAAYELVTDSEPGPDLAMVAAQYGRLLTIGGHDDVAGPVLERALELAEHLQLPEVYAQGLASKGVRLINRGRPSEARLVLQGSLDAALKGGFGPAALRAYNNLTVVLEITDSLVEAREMCDRALAFARQVGDREHELAFLTGSLVILFRLGEWDEALARLEEAEEADELGALEWARASLADAIPIYTARGQMDEAARRLEAHAGAATSESIQSRLIHAVNAAALLRAQGHPAEAAAMAESALESRDLYGLTDTSIKRAIVEATDALLDSGNLEGANRVLALVESARPGELAPWLRGESARLSARLAALRGDVDSVEPAYLAAERTLRDLRTPFDLAVACLEHAEWLVSRGSDVPDALVAEAGDIFTRLRAAPFADRLARLRAHERPFVSP